jgi:hypothetical protein
MSDYPKYFIHILHIIGDEKDLDEKFEQDFNIQGAIKKCMQNDHGEYEEDNTTLQLETIYFHTQETRDRAMEVLYILWDKVSGAVLDCNNDIKFVTGAYLSTADDASIN